MLLFFILCLLWYQLTGQRMMTKLQANATAYTSLRMRMLNEVGTLLLVAIVFLVVMRNSISWIWGALGLIGIGVLLTLAVKMYKRAREKGADSSSQTKS